MQARTDGWRSVSSGIRSMRRPAIHSDDDDDDDDDGDLLRTCFLILAFTSVIFSLFVFNASAGEKNAPPFLSVGFRRYP